MRTSLFILLLSLLTSSLMAQNATIINGTADKKSYAKVFLYKVLNGRLVEIATATPDSSERFAFKFTPEYQGLYAVGGSDALSLRHVFKFYFKGNDELNIRLEKANYSLSGNNSPENIALTDWFKASYSLLDKSVYWTTISTYMDFFPEVEEMYTQLDAIKSRNKTGNAKFDAFFSKIVDFDFANLAIGYLYTPRSAHPSKEELSDYYIQFKSDPFLSEDLLKFPYGDRFMTSLVYKKIDMSSKPTFQQQVEVIPADILKGQYVLARLSGARSYSDYQDMYNQYKQYFILKDQQERAQAIAVKLADTKEGTQAIAFSYPDITGKKVSLADLKGKLVLIDLWATWCGPCKAEEPHWEKLNEQFKGKDIAFVGISVDQDKKAWDKYVPEKNLKGIQLHAGPGNDLSAAYKVTGIPRYMLIDKKGNIITTDSPRPSDPKLKSLIETWLAR